MMIEYLSGMCSAKDEKKILIDFRIVFCKEYQNKENRTWQRRRTHKVRLREA